MARNLWVLIWVTFVLVACSTPASRTAQLEVTIAANEFAFTPSNFEATAGQSTKLMLRNTGAVAHDFSITTIPLAGPATSDGASQDLEGHDHDTAGAQDQLQVHVAAPAGRTSSLEFTPTEPGQYEFYCAVPGHKAAGMQGTLTVKAP